MLILLSGNWIRHVDACCTLCTLWIWMCPYLLPIRFDPQDTLSERKRDLSKGLCLLQVTRATKPVLINAWDRTLADWIRRGEEATHDYEAVRLNEIDMENGLYRYRVNSVFGSKYALTDDEVVTPQDDLGAQVSSHLLWLISFGSSTVL